MDRLNKFKFRDLICHLGVVCFFVFPLWAINARAGDYVLDQDGDLAKIVKRNSDGSVEVTFVKSFVSGHIDGLFTLKVGEFTESVDSYDKIRSDLFVKAKAAPADSTIESRIVKPTAIFPDGRIAVSGLIIKNGEPENLIVKYDELELSNNKEITKNSRPSPTQVSTAPNVKLLSSETFSNAEMSVYDRMANGGIAGRLSIATALIGAVDSIIDSQIDSAISMGQCPMLADSRAAYESLAKFDISTVKRVKLSCQKIGEEIQFPSYAKKLKSDSKAGFSNVTCSASGDINVIHHNGMTSTLHFSEPGRLDSITTVPSDQDNEFKVTYKRAPDLSGKWQITMVATQGDSKTHMEERYQSLLNQIYCTRSPCSDQDIMLGIPLDEAVSRAFPFGLETTPVSLNASEDLMEIKNLLTAQKGVAAFKSTCEFLGGKVPEDNVFNQPAQDPEPQRSAASAVVN
jgi:hypothetical protein